MIYFIIWLLVGLLLYLTFYDKIKMEKHLIFISSMSWPLWIALATLFWMLVMALAIGILLYVLFAAIVGANQ